MAAWLERISIQRLLVSNFSKWKIVLFSLIFILLIDSLDYFIGGFLHLSVFLLAPVAVVAWNLGFGFGIAFSILSASYLMVDYAIRPQLFPHPWVVLWDASAVIIYLSIISLILTALKKELENAFQKSRTDGLTGLLNSSAFFELAEQERARAERYGHPFTLCFIDLDNFKKINDSHGHLTGDKLLKKVSSILKNEVRMIDLVARLGGDEFVILFPETGPKAAERLTMKLHQAVDEGIKAELPLVTLSMGVVTYFEVPQKIDDVIHAADLLMYEAKKDGKNLIRCKTVGLPIAVRHA